MRALAEVFVPAVCFLASIAAATMLLSQCAVQQHSETLACTQAGGVMFGDRCVWSQQMEPR